MSAWLLTSILLQAAPPVTPPAEAEAVVVGERVPKKLREVASSVEVFDAQRLASESGADRLDQLIEATPNLQQGNGAQGPTIRGQDSTGVLADLPGFLGGARPRVTLYVDGRAAGFNELIFGATPLWDVAQVEVLRSPQSTVQGRNSIAGAIIVSTQSPRFTPEGKGRVMIGNDGMRQVSALVGGPLVDGKLAFRLSADARRIDPASDIAHTMRGAIPDEDRYALVRLKLLATPQKGTKVEAGLSRTTAFAPQIERIVAPFMERRDPSPSYGIFGTGATSLTVRADQRLSSTLNAQATASAGWAHFRRYAPPGVGEARNRTRDLSIDAWLDWRPSEEWRVTSGVHALRYALNQQIDLSAIIGLGAFKDRQSSLGLFGEATWKPRPDLEVTVGGRLQRDRQDRIGAIVAPSQRLPIDYHQTFDFFLPKVAVRWSPNERWTIGVMAQRATNPGGTSLNFENGLPELFDAERLWSAEAFARLRTENGRLTLSANLFHNWHRDAQRAEPVLYRPPGGRPLTWFRLYNVPRATSEGAEFAGSWRPLTSLGLRVGLGLLRTHIADDPDTPPQFAGKDFQRSPKLTASAEVDWTPVDPLRLSLQLRHHGRYFSNDENTPTRTIASGTRFDANARWRIGHVTMVAFARNLLDKLQLTYLYSPTIATAIEPRRVGLGLEMSY